MRPSHSTLLAIFVLATTHGLGPAVLAGERPVVCEKQLYDAAKGHNEKARHLARRGELAEAYDELIVAHRICPDPARGALGAEGAPRNCRIDE